MPFDYTNWAPLTPQEAVEQFREFASDWCIAGGWGLDLFMGKQTREHGDIDILIFRKDQGKVQSLLADHELFVVDPPGQLRPWLPGETLAPPLYNIWVRAHADAPWSIQLMIQDTEGEEWVFRRDHTIRGALSKMIVYSSAAWPILSPEIQLLYKGKSIGAKDQADFNHLLPYLSTPQKEWLREKLKTAYGNFHHWVAGL